uniref:Uncharacterized protein n=1 Tax=Ciona intestinalis TaxID=7719 RepID=H2XN61_CIOIN
EVEDSLPKLQKITKAGKTCLIATAKHYIHTSQPQSFNVWFPSVDNKQYSS